MNTPQPEVLERLRDIPSLRDKPNRIYSWPEAPRPEYLPHRRETARITGCDSLAWRWANQERVDQVVEICLETDAKICLHVSPDPPETPGRVLAVDAAIKKYNEQWDTFRKLLMRRVPIEVVYIDLEGFKYKPGNHERNKEVARLNRAVYDIAKLYVGNYVEVRRYGHLSVHPVKDSDYGGWEASRDTTAFDGVDGGFGVSLYNILDTVGQHQLLKKTISNAKRYGVNQGTVWIGLGGAYIKDWLCPGTFPQLDYTDKRFRTIPHDPRLAYELGDKFGNSWCNRVTHGMSQRNDRFPNTTNLDVVLWPGWFGEEEDKTHGVQLLAFLQGMRALPWAVRVKIIDDLRELQAKYWKQP